MRGHVRSLSTFIRGARRRRSLQVLVLVCGLAFVIFSWRWASLLYQGVFGPGRSTGFHVEPRMIVIACADEDMYWTTQIPSHFPYLLYCKTNNASQANIQKAIIRYSNTALCPSVLCALTLYLPLSVHMLC